MRSGRNRGRHHGLPAGLAIGDDDGLALGIGVAPGDLLDEGRLGVADVLDRLARHRLGRKADEVAGMAGADRHADFALGLHAPDARTVARARIDDDDRRFGRIHGGAVGRKDAHEFVVDRARQLSSVKDELVVEVQYVGDLLRRLGEMNVSPLVQSFERQDAPLPGVRPVLHSLLKHRRLL